MSHWQPDARRPRPALPPPAVPPQFSRRLQRSALALRTLPSRRPPALGYRATQQVRQLRPAGQQPPQPRWHPSPDPQRAKPGAKKPPAFLWALGVAQVSFVAWLVTVLARHDGAHLVIVAGWLALDLLLGAGYGVYRLASHR